jgi:hypothetical protein
MGQGLFDLLGWGVLEAPERLLPQPDGIPLVDDAVFAAVEHLGLQHASETEPNYIVVPLAVSSTVLQDWWKLPPLPDWTPRVGPRRARRVTSRLAARDAQALARQRGLDLTAIWAEAQAIYTTKPFPLARADMQAAMAHLGGIRRWHQIQHHARQRSLVFHKLAQLEEGPTVASAPFGLASKP